MKASDFMTAAAVVFAAQHSHKTHAGIPEIDGFTDDIVAQRVCEIANAMCANYERICQPFDDAEN